MGTTIVVRQVCDAIEGGPTTNVRESFAALLERYRPRAFALCLRITGDRALAARLADDTLWQLLFELPHLDGIGRMRPRILSIARRLAIEAVRRPGELLIQDGVVAADSEVGQHLTQLSWTERSRVVARAFTGLDPPLRAAAHLRYVENLPHRAIVSWLGSATASRQLERNRQLLSNSITSVLA